MATAPELQASLVSSDQNKENISISKDKESTVFVHQTQPDDDVLETRLDTQSPRRMKDIHLDGNVDDMRNVDPYMLDDRDLDIRSDVGGVAGSVTSLISARSSSVKSANSSRRLKLKSAGTPLPRSNAGSRSRQLKDHEGSPFLSIGMPQERNAFSPEIIKGKLSRSSYKGSRHSSLLSVSTAGLTSNSVKSSMEMTSARSHRSKLFSANSMIPPSKRTPQPNHNVKMPFKHSVKTPEMNVSSSNPSIAMKDRTAIATHTLNKLIHTQKPTHTTYIQGRLLKARLKPLEPVKLTTPTIHQCRGIVAETRQYSQCESRTFQRWKSIVSGNHQLPASKSFDVRDGASTCESVHQTSQASTPEPEVDFPTYDIDDNGLYDDTDWAEELGGPIDENGIPQSVQAPTPFSLPNSRCAPAHCDEALSHLGGPAMTPIPIKDSNQSQGHTPVMMTSSSSLPMGLEDQVSRNQKEASEEETSNGGLGTSDTIGETNTVASSDVVQSNTGVAPLPVNMTKRPHSAVYHQESSSAALKESRLAVRPKTAVDGSRKAVRFADEANDGNSVGGKGSVDSDLFGDEERVRKRGGGGNKNGKGFGKSSCRPRSLDSGFDDRDGKDDDDGNGGGGVERGNKGRTFLTQGFCVNGAQTNSQQQGGGRSSAQGSNGKQNSLKTDATSIGDSLAVNDDKLAASMSLEKNNNVENPNRLNSSCQSATVFYVTPKDEGRSDQTKLIPKSGCISQKIVGNKKTKTPRKDSKSNRVGLSKEGETTASSKMNPDKSSDNAVHDKNSNGNEKTKNKIEISSLKSSLCKQESTDSGISDSLKDEENSGTKSQTSEESQSSSVTTTTARIEATQMIRPTSSSVKRMKAYKSLIEKTKRGNVRPYSGSVYSDVEIQDRKTLHKQRKDLRPASAVGNSSHSDILQIQGKYGLYAGAKTANPMPTAPKSRSSSASSTTSKSKKINKSRNSNPISSESNSLSQEESNFSLLQVEKDQIGESDCSSLRPKSVSKVTFADEDEYEDDRSSRKSTVTSAKSMSHSSSILRGSATGYTHSRGSKHGDEVADDIDYDQMWAELPDDNSEKSFYDDDDDGIDDCDDFMSKFDMLQNQFDTVAAEFKAERTKLCSNDLISLSSSNNIASCIKNNSQKSANEELSRPSSSQNSLATATDSSNKDRMDVIHADNAFVSEEEMEMIRASGYKLESNNTIFVTDDSDFDDDIQNIDASYNENDKNGSNNFYNDLENGKLDCQRKNEFLQFEEPGWKENGWICAEISKNLYKSTNRYVEVKPKDNNVLRSDVKDDKKTSSVTASRVDHGQKKNSQKGRQERKGSKGDNDGENLNGEYRKPVYKMENGTENSGSVHIVIPSMDDFGFGFSCEGTAKPKSHRALSSRATTPAAARKLSKSKHGSENEDTSSKHSDRGKKKDGDLCIDANSCNILENRTTPTPVPKEPKDGSHAQNSDSKNDKNNTSLGSFTPATGSGSSFISKESESMTTREAGERTNNYYDILLAYRSHCMEDSDEEDDKNFDDVNENDDLITHNDDKCNSIGDDGMKKSSRENEDKSGAIPQDNGNKTDNENKNIDFSNQSGGKAIGGEAVYDSNGVRPISAVTTDSGLESDSHAEEVGNQSRRQSIPDSLVSSEDSQSRTQSRPDSGILSDAGVEKQSLDGSNKPLEIIASSKTLIKQRPSSASNSGHGQPSENMEKLCKLPPLCFQLNARPPSGFLYYFAYGPNMNSDRISCYLGCEKSPPRFWAVLFGFGIAFNMKGTSSNSDQVGGLPNLEWNPAMSVEGCVYQITQEQLDRLDKFVGYPKIVEHVVLPVWMSNSLDPDLLGVAQYCVPALTFIARDAFTWKELVPASEYSVSQCIKSADLVTPEFKGHLASFSSNNQLAVVAAS